MKWLNFTLNTARCVQMFLKKNAEPKLQRCYLHAEEARVTRAGLVSRSVPMRQVI